MADHPGFLPLNHSTALAALPISHAGDLAMGGYSVPLTSNLGSHEQRSSAEIESITAGTWLPQPHQVAFSIALLDVCSNAMGRETYCKYHKLPFCTLYKIRIGRFGSIEISTGEAVGWRLIGRSCWWGYCYWVYGGAGAPATGQILYNYNINSKNKWNDI